MYNLIVYGGIFAAVIFSVINKYGLSADTLFPAALLSILLYMSIKDSKERRVPGGALTASAVLCCARTVNADAFLAELEKAAAGSGVVFLLLIFAVFICELLLKKKMMGGADMKILILLGAWFGAEGGILIIFLTCVFALPAASSGIFFSHFSGPFPENKKGTFALMPAIFLAAWAVILFY